MTDVNKGTAFGLILVHAFLAILVDLGFTVLFVFGLMFSNDPTGRPLEEVATIGIYPAILSLTLPWGIIAYNLKRYAQAAWVSLGGVAFIPTCLMSRIIITKLFP